MDPAAAGRAGRRRGRSRRIKGTAHVSWRDTMCGVLRAGDAGRRVTLAGWVDARRDHGGLVFIDLRDHTGLVQLVVRPENDPVAHDVRNEVVLQAEGEIVARAPDAVNPNIPTGEVEIQVDTLRIVSTSEPLPFQIGDESVDEVLRLRYRYLDMRGDRMQRNLRLNHVIINAIRRTMDDLAFVDVWTPSMTKGTPEGARDFLVPVRLQPGKFYALAQSPQLFKQLCMVGGLDRYYQIATCWRDEDLRADRQFEFRQLDLEMSFVEREDVLDVLERCVVASFEAVGREAPPRPFPRMQYAEAIARYGTDKPDLRFGLAIEDATEVTRGSQFGVFANAPCVRYIVVPRMFSRSEHARLEEIAKEWGAKGLAQLGQISKFLSDAELSAFGVQEGSTALFVADEEFEADPGSALSQHYDLIWNGWELGSGSIRIHDVELQQRVFRTMGLREEEAQSKFGFLLEALAMGAPPHGGFAMGIERFVAQLAGEPDIRQVVAFPKIASGSDPLTGAPTPMPNQVLQELGIKA